MGSIGGRQKAALTRRAFEARLRGSDQQVEVVSAASRPASMITARRVQRITFAMSLGSIIGATIGGLTVAYASAVFVKLLLGGLLIAASIKTMVDHRQVPRHFGLTVTCRGFRTFSDASRLSQSR